MQAASAGPAGCQAPRRGFHRFARRAVLRLAKARRRHRVCARAAASSVCSALFLRFAAITWPRCPAPGKRATIFVAARTRPHPRTLEAARLGAKVVPISPGYLLVMQSRAREYCRNTGATLIPFGAEIPGAVEAIAAAARLAAFAPEEVWCAAGSGVLACGLAAAWPKARRHVVQIGRDLTPREVAGATIHVHPRKFSDSAALAAPFPVDPHYDAKAWELCIAKRGPGRVLFWNVAPLARG